VPSLARESFPGTWLCLLYTFRPRPTWWQPLLAPKETAKQCERAKKGGHLTAQRCRLVHGIASCTVHSSTGLELGNDQV